MRRKNQEASLGRNSGMGEASITNNMSASMTLLKLFALAALFLAFSMVYSAVAYTNNEQLGSSTIPEQPALETERALKEKNKLEDSPLSTIQGLESSMSTTNPPLVDVAANKDTFTIIKEPWHDIAPVLDGTHIPEWMIRYMEFHKYSLANPLNGTLEDQNHYLIFTCKKNKQRSCSGTGNRQRAMAAMFLVAMLTNRIFLIDVDNPIQLSEILEPHLVNWIASPSLLSHLEDLPSVFLNVRNKNPFALDRPQDFAVGVKPQVVQVLANSPTTLHGIWRSPQMTKYLAAKCPKHDRKLRAYREDLKRSIFYVLFRPTAALIAETQQQQRSLGLIIEGIDGQSPQIRPYTAVHVRAGGDWGGTNEARCNRTQMESYYEAARQLTPNDEKMPIVVVSDTLVAKTTLHAIDPGRVRIVTNTSLVHVDRSNGQTLQSSLQVWADVLILAQSKCMVRSAGSFGALALKISENVDKEHCTIRLSQ